MNNYRIKSLLLCITFALTGFIASTSLAADAEQLSAVAPSAVVSPDVTNQLPATEPVNAAIPSNEMPKPSQQDVPQPNMPTPPTPPMPQSANIESANTTNAPNEATIRAVEGLPVPTVQQPNLTASSYGQQSVTIVGNSDAQAMQPIARDVVEVLLNNLNGHDPIRIAELFSKESFAFVPSNGQMLKSISDIGSYYSAINADQPHMLNFSIDSIVDIAPGAAVVVGAFNNAGNQKEQGMFSGVLKFENSQWKMVSLQMTAVPEKIATQEQQSSNLGVIGSALIGAVLGFLGAKLWRTKQED